MVEICPLFRARLSSLQSACPLYNFIGRSTVTILNFMCMCTIMASCACVSLLKLMLYININYFDKTQQLITYIATSIVYVTCINKHT